MEVSLPSIGVGVFVEHVTISHQTWVILSLQCILHCGFHFFPQIRVSVSICKIGEALTIGFDIEHFVFRSKTECKLPMFVVSTGSAGVNQFGFCWAAISIQVPGFRVSCRPTLGFEVAYQKKRALDNSAYRITFVVGATHIVSFFSNQQKVSVRVIRLLAEKVGQGLPR